MSASTHDTDQLDHAIEHAWSLLDAGDHDGAHAAHHALAARAPNHPETFAIGAALSAMDGDAEAALAGFARASEIDPQNGRYHIFAAELHLHALDDVHAAVEACDRALDVTDDEDELIDAVLLKAEALVSAGDHDDEARDALGELEGCIIDDPGQFCRAADLFFMLGDLEGAESAYRDAVNIADDWADGYHGLGMVYEALGKHEEMVEAWLRTLELDRETEPPPWEANPDQIREITLTALGELSDETYPWARSTEVEVADAPSEEMVKNGIDPRVFVLLAPTSGEAAEDEDAGDNLDRGTAILLFQRNLERICQSEEDLREELRGIIQREVARVLSPDSDEDGHKHEAEPN